VPVFLTGHGVRPGVDIGTRKTFADLGQTIAEVFGVGPLDHGSSFLASILVREERTGETRKEKG
jgi:phosphopentomutase